MNRVLTAVEPSPRFRRWFAWYTKRMIQRSFHRVMLHKEGLETIQSATQHNGPLIVSASHASWWDPLFALRLAEAFVPDRTLCAPIEMQQYERFGILRKLGLFGIDQHHAEALPKMIQHVQERVSVHPNLLFCITPQGEFSDVRRPIRIRPGVAAVAAALPGARVLALCGEYTFWQDRKPEVFWHARVCDKDNENTTSGWHRVIRKTMRQTADELAEQVISRDTSAFTSLPDEKNNRSRTAVNPLYDVWLRLRGVGARIESTRQAAGQHPSQTGDVS